jgi:hypothetical protein
MVIQVRTCNVGKLHWRLPIQAHLISSKIALGAQVCTCLLCIVRNDLKVVACSDHAPLVDLRLQYRRRLLRPNHQIEVYAVGEEVILRIRLNKSL